MAEWTGTPGVVGCRVMLANSDYEADHPGLNAIFAACARAGVPVNVMAAGKLPLLTELARRNPDTSVIIDHVGLAQPFVPPPPAEPFADLPNVLAAAELDNVVIKISGACTLSHEPFPYPDIWDSLGRIFDAYGLDRCLWGTDWTRAVPPPDLRAGRGVLPGNRPPDRFRPRYPHGRHPGAGVQLDARLIANRQGNKGLRSPLSTTLR